MELHATGASFIAQSKDANPLEVVKMVIAEMPSSDRRKRFEEFERLIAKDDDLERAVRWYFFVNMHDYLTTNRSRTKSPEERTARAVERAGHVAHAAERIKQQIVLLDLLLPNGKRLRDATFAECGKARGWFGKVEKMGKPNQIVGKVLTEEQLRAVK